MINAPSYMVAFWWDESKFLWLAYRYAETTWNGPSGISEDMIVQRLTELLKIRLIDRTCLGFQADR